MAIVFHCEHCGKKIEAQDKAAGKWGKCPGCRNKIYIPDLKPAKEDEFKLAPIDENEERKKRQLMAETFHLSQFIMQQKEGAKDVSDGQTAYIPNITKLNNEELKKQIIAYIKYSADEDEETSKRLAGLITTHGHQALKILDRIALGHISEPELEKIPQHILSGVIKMLRSRLVQS